MLKKDIHDHPHTPEGIAERLAKPPKPSYLRDWVYGGIDGAVTTFAIVAGVLGAQLATKVIIILGLANVVADGFSMAAGNYLSTKSEHDEFEYYKDIELKHIENYPEGETEEIREIYKQKGFEGDNLEYIVTKITNNKEQWLNIMLQEEYGLSSTLRSPWIAAINTFSAFMICGLVPLLPFFLHLPLPAAIASCMTGVTFFLIGSAKSRWALTSWWRSGLQTFLIGGGAAIISFILGWLIERPGF